MDNINQHIQFNKNKLEDPVISSQSRRYYENELESLERYRERYPEDTHDPTPFELYCSDNPDASECRIYES